MRRGQLVGNIVIFVIGLMVVGAVLYFGVAIYNDLRAQHCGQREIQFTQNLDDILEKNRGLGRNGYSLLGLCNTETGADMEAICFVDRGTADGHAQVAQGNTPATPPGPVLFIPDADTERDIPQYARVTRLIATQVENGDNTNVFVVMTDGSLVDLRKTSSQGAPVTVQQSGTVAGNPVTYNAQCFTTPDAQFDFIVEGQGQEVRIVKPTP